MVRRISLLIFLVIVSTVHSVSDVIPAIVSDSYGNTADSDSQVTWADIPGGKPYETDPDAYSAQGFEALYNAMHGFVSVIFGAEMPWDVILGIINATTAFDMDVIMTFLKFGYGYGACIAVGLLFILIFPIIGCCMCCCRVCCGNCGGKMVQKRTSSSNAWRLCYIVSLSISCTFLGVGVICTYVSNERMRTLFDDISTTIDSNVNDFQLYANNTVDEINYIAIDGFNFTGKVMFRDLDNIGRLVGGAVQEDLNNQAGVDVAFDELLALDPLLLSLIIDLETVKASRSSVTTAVTSLDTAMKTLATDIQATFSACGANCGSAPDTSNLEANFDPSTMPSFDSQLVDLQNVYAQNITALVLDGKKEFDNITGLVETEAKPVVDQIKSMVKTFETTITDSLSQINEMLSLFDSLNSITGMLDLSTLELGGSLTLPDIEQYRWYGGLGLTVFPLIVLCLQLIGLIMGCVACMCTDKDALPTKRGCVGNCGGCLLMVSVVLVFIFGSLLMLLVLITFAIGAPMERVLCKEVRDPEFTIWKTIFDGGDPATGPHMTVLGEKMGYTLGELLYQDLSVPLKVSGLLAACRDNKGAYETLHLSRLFNLSDITNYRSSIDMESEINNNLNVDLSTLVLLDDNTKQQIEDMSSALSSINYGQLDTSLQADTSLVNFDDLHSTLTQAAEAASNAGSITEASELTGHATELRRIENDEYVAVSQSQTFMLDKVTALRATAATLPTTVDNLLTTLNTTQLSLQANGVQIIKNQSLDYANRVLGVADQFVAQAVHNVENELGRCKPIHNFYETVLTQLICGTLFDNWNSVWFTLGWCLFFMVFGVIFSVKLAKHIRKMKDLHPEDTQTNGVQNYGGDKKVHPI